MSKDSITVNAPNALTRNLAAMKVAIVGTAWPYRGGISALNERLAVELQRQGHEVLIVNFTLQYPSLFFPGKTQLDDRPAPALPIVRSLNSINPLSWYHTAVLLRRWGAQKVVVRYWTPFLAPALGAVAHLVGRRNAEVVAVVDNLFPHERRWFDAALTRWFVGGPKRFVALSRSVQAEFLAHYGTMGKRCDFVPHPVYDVYGDALPQAEARRQLGLRNDGRYMLFFGFIREYKGLDLLLEAMAETAVMETNAELLVAGEFYGNEADYLQLIQRLGIANKVHLHTHFIAETEVSKYFCAADVVVQPYRTATQSGVTQIAYHFGVPMIVTNVGALPEMVPHGVAGFVCEPTASSVANSVAEFFSDSPLRFASGVAQTKSQFSWRRLADVVLGVEVSS